jgi:hypothetical protein
MNGKMLAGLRMEHYLALPAVSASVLKAMLDKCPRAAWYESWLNEDRVREDSAIMDAGTIAHAILLEGSQDCCSVIDPNDHPAEKTGAIPEGWTNKSIRVARDEARARGKIPILKPAMEEIGAMVRSAQAYIDSLKETEPAVWKAFQPDGGESEVTITWDDGATPCRIRPDKISTDHRLMVDLKFTGTSSNPEAWSRHLFASDYDISAAFYCRGIAAIHGVISTYVFLVVNTDAPYLCSLVGLDPAALDLASQKVSYGLRQWASCVKANHWPEYPKRICYAEPPAWAAAQWEERQMEEPWGATA